jgi:hydrogenase-4 membrane subunit HyfE
MELPGWGYFYSLAALSMAFAGFTSIVVVLHQGTGKSLSQFHVLLTSLFIELGLMATAFAILAPTLAICGIREIIVWQISSAIMLVILVPWLIAYPFRRKRAAPKQRLPVRVYIMTILGTVAVIALGLNIVGAVINPGPGPLVITTVYVLSYASVAFIGSYSYFLRS